MTTPGRRRCASVAFDQKLGEQVPLDLSFRDERGKAVRLGDYFGREPVLLNFVYYSATIFARLLFDGLVRSLRALSFDIGNQFAVVTVSFDPARQRRTGGGQEERSARTLCPARCREHGWHFLTGDADSIRRLAERGRVSLQLRCANGRVRPCHGNRALDPGRKNLALLLRHRVFAARSASGVDRSRRRRDRLADRSTVALLLSLRSRHRQIRSCSSPT